MRFVSARRRGVSVVLGALVLGACGSDGETATAVVPVESTATSTTSTTAAPTSTTPLGIDADEFASQFRLSLDHINEGFGEIAAEFVERVTGGPDRIQLEVDLSRMQVELVDEAIEGLPKQPDDESLAALYEPMVAALIRWGDVAGETADDLEASKQELAARWESQESAERFNAIQGRLPIAYDEFTSACLDLAAPVLDATSVAVDCLGVPEPDPVADGSAGALGGIEVVLEPAAGLVLTQASDDRIDVSAEGNDQLTFVISSNPSFADPAGPLDVLRVEGGTDWPDDIDGWIESVGAAVEDSGEATIGGFPAEYWDVSITEERANDISGGHPAVAVVGIGGNGSDIVQFQDLAIMRLYRIVVDPATSLLAFTGGVNTAAPGAEGIPPFIPRAEEAFEWLEASLPSIEMF